MSHDSKMSQFPATSSLSSNSPIATTTRLHVFRDSGASEGPTLTSLPPEILIKVLSEIPLSSLLDLTHTSRGLRAFVKDNAARIAIWLFGPDSFMRSRSWRQPQTTAKADSS
jgi:hypothetical protein